MRTKKRKPQCLWSVCKRDESSFYSGFRSAVKPFAIRCCFAVANVLRPCSWCLAGSLPHNLRRLSLSPLSSTGPFSRTSSFHTILGARGRRHGRQPLNPGAGPGPVALPEAFGGNRRLYTLAAPAADHLVSIPVHGCPIPVHGCPIPVHARSTIIVVIYSVFCVICAGGSINKSLYTWHRRTPKLHLLLA